MNEELIKRLRTRLDDIDTGNQEYDDQTLGNHIQNSLDKHEMTLPLDRKSDEQLILIESLIAIVTALKLWADGESYSYKNDAIQMTRGLMSKHYQDTIRILRTERDDILEGNGGIY
jgi:hypothetical protein